MLIIAEMLLIAMLAAGGLSDGRGYEGSRGGDCGDTSSFNTGYEGQPGNQSNGGGSNGSGGYEGQPGNQGNGNGGYEGQPGNQSGGGR